MTARFTKKPPAITIAAALSFLLLGFGGDGSGGPSADDPVVVHGILEFTPAPEVTICFCGSYFLASEKTRPGYYLVSDTIDLTPYIGESIQVTGRKFTSACTGTLLLPCDYLRVEKVIDPITTGAEPTTWGAVKSLYRNP
jgi:hypothetical protein